MGNAARVLEERYTYTDYCNWPDDERWELIEGVPYAMSPGPSVSHQSVSTAIIRLLSTFLAGKTCKVFAAPLDVRLNADGADDTVVQPDILVVCDKKKLENGKAVIGAPDLVIEILSPSSVAHDAIRKRHTYQKYGVREYWIVDPEDKAVNTHVLREGLYLSRLYTLSDDKTVPVEILDGFELALEEIFAE